MPLRGLRRRMAPEWLIRLGLALVLAALGGQSVTRTIAYAIRGSAPEQAHALAPEDGRITALLAAKLSGAEASLAERARADRLAREALRQDPTAVTAASVLGINAQVRGDTRKARRLFNYSQALSRRDVQTQVWAIEDAVGRGDVAGALLHYDIALRTSPNAPDLLFPILAPAISAGGVRAALVRTMARKPLWYPAFVSYVAQNGPDPRATADLFQALRRAGVPISGDADSALIATLLNKDAAGEAWAYYATVRSVQDRNRSRDPQFAVRSDTPTPFDWILLNDTGMSASIQRGQAGNVFEFAAPASLGGALLTQVQMLPPGEYRLEGRGEGIDQPNDSHPYWALTCRGGSELGRVVLPNSAQAGGTFSGRFVVPPNCPVQALTLFAQPSSAVAGVAGRIDRVLLSQVR